MSKRSEDAEASSAKKFYRAGASLIAPGLLWIALAVISARTSAETCNEPPGLALTITLCETAGVGCVLLSAVLTSVAVWHSFARARRYGGRDRLLLHSAARTLPPEVREEYLEEWLGWQWDLRARGASRWRWAAEILSVLLRLPWLIIAARLGQRVVR